MGFGQAAIDGEAAGAAFPFPDFPHRFPRHRDRHLVAECVFERAEIIMQRAGRLNHAAGQTVQFFLVAFPVIFGAGQHPVRL